ncbi:tRNA A37 threonylcarbamoyladenosine dehydratase [Bacilli bacterium PM5-9]|nr:tRNA A37 threonylcarbamoyladenosine dehydratase [Bacilli bacterium PM5-9]
MMKEQFNRLEILVKDQLEDIQNSSVLIVGIGGVGSYAAESIARCGIKKIIIVDKDIVDITNLNRQLIALHSTINQNKVDVMKKRINDINPLCEVVALNLFFNEDTLDDVFSCEIDFVIDACDTIESKFLIIKYCLDNKIPFISSMGAANKFDATKVEIIDLMKTYNDPVAKVLRNKVKKARLKGKIPVVFSNEVPFKPKCPIVEDDNISRKELPLLGSNSFVPSTFGLVCSNYCFNYLKDKAEKK